ncbi:hypothetical protein P7C73_g1211, partial [Tremellales sp. Uapishka_1]
MTQIPVAAMDLPPPPPSADPREPSPAHSTANPRASRTPVKHRSPAASRTSSPQPLSHRSLSPDVPLHQPVARNATSSPGAVAIQSLPHHLASRPSSPSSIHSSSSAIFERDIEAAPVASLTLNPANASNKLNHKPSKLHALPHGSNLDHTVPAVLDDAVEALARDSGPNAVELEIEAPSSSAAPHIMARHSSTSLAGVGGAKKMSPGPGDRSPSPISITSRTSGMSSPAQSPPIFGQVGSQPLGHDGSGSVSPVGLRPTLGARLSTGPLLPGGWAQAFGGAKAGTEAKPAASPAAIDETPAQPPQAALPSHLSPSKEKRRVSFLSYNDLLLSVPTTITPFDDITSGNLSPDHLPGTVSPAHGRSPIVPPPPGGTLEKQHSWEAGRNGGLGLGNDGEWSREGLGKGLEQRLEDLVVNEGKK